MLGALGVTGASVSGAATRAPQAGASARAASYAEAISGTQLWVKRYNGTGNGFDSAGSVAVSPGGGKVFVTGSSTGATSRGDYATVAYSTATGGQLWVSRYHGPGYSTAHAMVVSPDGSKVFVTGESERTTSGGDYTTVAYNASTGEQLWAKRYNGTGNRYDFAYAIAVSPNGSRVFVTGSSTGVTSGSDYATVAYNTATGAQLWVKRYDKGDDDANSVAVSPSGGKVYVAGHPATLAYSATSGALLWHRRDSGSSVAVSPGGGKVFVTGTSTGRTSGEDYATVAYSTATGAQLWVKRYNGPKNGPDRAAAMAVGRGGGKVFVTGSSGGTFPYADYATVAYSTATGAQLWVKRYNGPASRDDIAHSVAVSRTGKVFVTGQSIGAIRDDYYSGFDYATVAYSG